MDSDKIKLINLVKLTPLHYIFLTSASSFKELQSRNKLVEENWEKVANSMSYSVSECIQQWLEILKEYLSYIISQKSSVFYKDYFKPLDSLNLNSNSVCKLITSITRKHLFSQRVSTAHQVYNVRQGKDFKTNKNIKAITKTNSIKAKKPVTMSTLLNNLNIKNNRLKLLLNKKQKLDKIRKLGNPIHVFFANLAESAMKLPDDQISRLKVDVCKVVTSFQLNSIARETYKEELMKNKEDQADPILSD